MAFMIMQTLAFEPAELKHAEVLIRLAQETAQKHKIKMIIERKHKGLSFYTSKDANVVKEVLIKKLEELKS